MNYLNIDSDIICVVVTAYTYVNLEQIAELFIYQDQWIFLKGEGIKYYMFL